MKNANPVSGRRGGFWGACAAGLIAASAVTGCGGRPQAAAAATAAPKGLSEHFAIRVGGKLVNAQVAALEPEMERGLMERGKLGADEGMFFVYGKPQQLTFWMHDTPTPLDIGYFTPQGELAEIYPLLPFDERTVASRSSGLQFALEMNQGWYAANGVRVGDRIDLKALAEALRGRGFDPKDYGL